MKQSVRLQKEKKAYPLPLFSKIIYALTALSVILYGIFRINTAVSDFFNRTVGAFFRALLATVTNWIPFSLAETLLILLPLLFLLLLLYAVRHRCQSWRATLSFVGTVFSLVALLFVLFVFAFAPGYSGTSLDGKLGLERKDSSKEELCETLSILVDKVNENSVGILFREDGSSVMPYGISEMNEKLMASYDKVSKKYTFLQSFHSEVKPVLFSEAMSYTHITGVYSFFTGEANINVDFPDYTIPYTAAHELAHQRGIAREDEANFIAFLVCISSDDAYIRYSGYLNLYEYVANALAGADKTLYQKARASLEPLVKKEMQAYAVFFKKYQHSKVSEVSEKVNNSYLQVQGTVGTKSYGMVVDLTVAYYRPLFEGDS